MINHNNNNKENGCKQIITVQELDTHLKQCQFKFVECPNKKNGCEIQFRFNKLEILKDHEYLKEPNQDDVKLNNNHKSKLKEKILKIKQSYNYFPLRVII
ncbi:hypothetical protein ACTFIY_006104 [Dictyostelium cf. discoideum]